MSSTASTQEAELDALFRSHKLDNILPDAFALGAVLSAPTGHLADLYQFLACDPPTPLVLPTDISVFFHNELQNNCGPLNQSDSKLLARIFKNSYRPDNESLRALTLLDTTTTDHVYLYNTMNRSVTAAVEQLAIGLTQQLGLTTVLPSYPVPNDYPTLYRRPATSQEPAAKRNEPPTPRSVSTSVRRAQRTPRHSTGKARKTRSIQLVEPSPSNKATPRQRTSKTSMRAEILPEDKVPVSIRVKRGVNKIGERRKSSANPSSQTASNGLQSPQVTQPAETSPGSSQDLDVSGAGESHRAAHISESETGSLPEIEGNNDPMATPTAKDSSKKGNRRSREDESHEHLYTAKKTRICNSNYKNTATEDKEDGIDDAMIEDETHRLIEDNNGPSGQDQNGTMANAHMDVNDDTSDMTSIPGAGISPSKPSGDAMRDSDSATSPPSEIGDKTPFKIPKSKSLKKNASNSTPSTEDTPSSSRRSTRTQDRVTPGSESRVAVSRRNTSTTLTTPSRFPDKRFKCDVDGCSKSYNRLEHVQRHHQDTHQQLRPYPCPFEQCGKAFSRSYKLNKHIDTHRKSLKKSEDKRVNSRSVSWV